MESALNQVLDLLAIPRHERAKVSMQSDIEPMIKKGLSARAVVHLVAALEMPVSAVSTVLGISPRAFYSLKKSDRHVDMSLSDRTYRVAEVLATATAVLGSREKAVRWLNTPIQATGGETPFSKLGTEIGTARVKEVLGAIEYGVFT